jgi:hypothetical protein
MIRHAGLGPPQPIVALAHPMQSSASVGPLVTSIGRAELLPPRSPSAQWGCSSFARDRNRRRLRKRCHSHDSYGFGAQLRT